MKLIRLAAVLVMVLALSAVGHCAVPGPIAMSNNTIGGGALNQYTPGIYGASGVNNIGLLIKTWGTVTYVDTANKYFYVDDGSVRLDGSTHIGIRVSYDNLATGVTITTLPSVGNYVVVTGISSTIMINSKVQPNFRVRRQSDIQTVSIS